MQVNVIYKGRERSLPRSEARVLIALGLASVAEEREAVEVVTRAMEPEIQAVPVSPRTGKPKRQYKRRDMAAE